MASSSGAPTELWRWDAVDLAGAIRAKRISSREATLSALDRLDAVNPKLNAVALPLRDAALAAADAADAAVARGDELGLLHGVPVTMKENVDHAGLPTTNGIVAFAETVAREDSPPVANWKAAGAVIIGRTNTPGLSSRWDTVNPLRGRTRNPWSAARVPGGSSGAAASAVAAGIGALAHGNDYCGSIRHPAHCCGVAGIRPSFGRVPAYNPTTVGERPPTAQLMSVQGPLARRVRDLRLGLAAMARRDPRDPWWVPAPLEGPPPPRPIRVALCPAPRGMTTHPAIADAVRRTGTALADAGYAVEEVEPPSIEAVDAVWRKIVVGDTRRHQYPLALRVGDPDLIRSMELWFEVAPEVDLETYLAALAERTRHIRDWSLFLERYPLIVAPVSGAPPFEPGFDTADAASTAALLSAQTLLNIVPVLGLPAVSVPAGVMAAEDAPMGLPLGAQIIAARFREDLALDAAEAVEARLGLSTPVDPVW